MRPRVLDCVLGALIVCHHARSGFALNAARRSHLAGGTPDTQYLLLAHHKTGTALSFGLAYDLSAVLNKSFEPVTWMAVADASYSLLKQTHSYEQSDEERAQGEHLLDTVTSTGCTGSVMQYEDMRAPLLDQILKTCPGTRAVHLVRRPSSIVVSNYAYTKDLQPGWDRGPDVRRGQALSLLPLEWGVINECLIYFSSYHGQMLAVHQMIQDNKLDNILEVRFENFVTNYDNTTRSIFEHLVGSDHPSIDEYVKKASQHDVNRMDHVDRNPHVSGRTEKEDIEMEMTRLLENGNSCIKKLDEADRLMGYSQGLHSLSLWAK